jgi:tetratricopeptide (TPR) repeat protein
VKAESQRLEGVQFAKERAPRPVKIVPAERKPPELTGANKTIEEAEKLYQDKDWEAAKQAYLRVLQTTEDRSLHGRAYFGLARIAALQKDPETAEKLFQKTLEVATDPFVTSWSNVYLGRLADLQGARERASQYYAAALAVEGGSAAARKAAQEELKGSFQKK